MDILETYNMIRWILCAVGAALLCGLTPTLMRTGAKRADPSFAAALFASVLALFSVAVLYVDGRLSALTAIGNRSLLTLLASGLVTALLYLCLFTALTGTAVSRVMPVLNLSGILGAALGYFLFRENMWLWRLCCMVLILFGTVLLESREKFGSGLWLVYAVLALLALCGRELLLRVYADAAIDSALALPFSAGVAAVLLWAFALLRGKQKCAKKMGVKGWLSIPFAALCMAGATLLPLLGARLGEWSWLSPISCLGFLSMLVFARIFLKEKLSGSAVFGMILVLLGTFAMMMGW